MKLALNPLTITGDYYAIYHKNICASAERSNGYCHFCARWLGRSQACVADQRQQPAKNEYSFERGGQCGALL